MPCGTNARMRHRQSQPGQAWRGSERVCMAKWRSATADARKASLTAASLPRARAQLISVLSKCERCHELARHTGGGRRSLRVVRRGSTRCAQVFERSSTHGAQGRANRVASASEVGRAHPRRGCVCVCVCAWQRRAKRDSLIFTARARHFVLDDTSVHPRIHIKSRRKVSSMPSNASKPVAASEMRQTRAGVDEPKSASIGQRPKRMGTPQQCSSRALEQCVSRLAELHQFGQGIASRWRS